MHKLKGEGASDNALTSIRFKAPQLQCCRKYDGIRVDILMVLGAASLPSLLMM